MGKAPVGINLIEPATAEVIDYRARDNADAVRIPPVKPEVLQASCHGSDCFLAVGGTASKDDGIGVGGVIAVPQKVSIDGPRCTATNIYRDRGTVLEVNDGKPGRAFLVAAHSDLERRPVKGQRGAVDLGICLKHLLTASRRSEEAGTQHNCQGDRRQPKSG